ncbi:MAG: DUF3108 domain-containing protein [Burkholderiaceae bacterium]|jgi:hypothetical protein|nr:DUF3108 domain-containing protein [Burkholderiaceae bacterium]
MSALAVDSPAHRKRAILGRAAGARPAPWLIALVALAHLVLLDGAPQPLSPRAAPLQVAALFTRAVAAPEPPPQASAAPQRPAPAAPPPASAAKRPAPVAKRPAAAPARPTTAGRTGADKSRAARKPDPTVQSAAAVRVPGSALLRYRVTGSARGLHYEANAELRWRNEDPRYEVEWSVGLPLLGTRTQRSEGRLTEAGLAPERFAEKSRGERAAHFDAEGGRIRFSANTPDAVLEPGAQDRLSITLQLAALLAAAPDRYPPGASITLQTVGARDAEPWTWQVQPDETLTLAGQPLPTVKLLRQPRQEYDIRIELWLARTLDYLPVRLRLTQSNGDVADQQLQTVEQTSH